MFVLCIFLQRQAWNWLTYTVSSQLLVADSDLRQHNYRKRRTAAWESVRPIDFSGHGQMAFWIRRWQNTRLSPRNEASVVVTPGGGKNPRKINIVSQTQ